MKQYQGIMIILTQNNLSLNTLNQIKKIYNNEFILFKSNQWKID